VTSPFLYAGINPEVWQTLRYGTLARGQAEPRQVPRPADVGAATLAGISHIFVDGPALRLQRVLEEIEASGMSVPVIWIAREAERLRAHPDLVGRAAAVWEFPGPVLAWSLPGEAPLQALPETPVLVPEAVGEAEGERLAFLEAGAFETDGPDARLDRLTRWVTGYFGFPIAFVNLIGREMQMAKATAGLPEDMDMSMPKELSICQYVVAGNQPLVIPDIPQSTFFQDSGVAAMVGMQAYAGVPLLNDHDMVMGSLCMVDMEPHAISLTQLEVLHALAAVAAEALKEGRRTDGRLHMSSAAFHRLGRAIARDARDRHEPLSIGSLPDRAAAGEWDRDLEFLTLSDTMDCLVCLPRQDGKAARARLAGVAAALGLPAQSVVVASGQGEAWANVLNTLALAHKQARQQV
jgi:type IV secretory pathway VirB2 component (pilin)